MVEIERYREELQRGYGRDKKIYRRAIERERVRYRYTVERGSAGIQRR